MNKTLTSLATVLALSFCVPAYAQDNAAPAGQPAVQKDTKAVTQDKGAAVDKKDTKAVKTHKGKHKGKKPVKAKKADDSKTTPEKQGK